MPPHTPRLRAGLLVCVLALAVGLGTVGGATAAGLTKKTVRKIAAKVVKKQAPGLSVARAADADRVGGATAAQLRTAEYRYAIPATAPSSVQVYEFPALPAGSYQVGYWYRAETSVATAGIACDVTPSAADQSIAESFGVTNGAGVSRGSATGGLTTTTGPVQLNCSTAAGTMSMIGQVSFVRVDTVVTGTATGS